MTEPPRPPGESGPGGYPPDPTSPPPPGSYSTPGEASGYPPPAAPQYDTPGAPPPTSGGGAYPPPGDYPPGGYPPAGGYGPPGGGYPGGGYPGGPPAGYANADDKTWALVAHFGGAAGAFIGFGAGGWVAPLIALLVRGNESPTARQHAVAALNFQILWSIIAIIGFITFCFVVGIFIAIAAWAIATIVGIMAGLKATNGELHRYPMSINMIK